MPTDIHPVEPSSPPQKVCFILGILPRSGTHYIQMLLKEHPDCFGQGASAGEGEWQGPIAEDFLVHCADMLRTYADSVHKKWHPPGRKTFKATPSSDTLLRCLGEGLRQFLQFHIIENEEARSVSPHTDSAKENRHTKLLITKSPSVVGAAHFFALFPDDYLIILVRDGRAVVESSARSFAWKYEDTMKKWAAGAQTILRLKEKYKNSDKKLLIVRYEDLVSDERTELLKIFDFLGLDPKRFDFDRAKALGVIGSSETKTEGSSVHWRSVEKPKNFNPLERFSHWDRKKHDRFNWIAGHAMTQFGYALQETGTSRYLGLVKQPLLDVMWHVQTNYLEISKKIVSFLKKVKRMLWGFWRK